jgi:hypothetical protein
MRRIRTELSWWATSIIARSPSVWLLKNGAIRGSGGSTASKTTLAGLVGFRQAGKSESARQEDKDKV